MKKDVKNKYDDGYIYYLYDRINQRIYVGSSYTKFSKRLYDHKYDMKAYLGQMTNKIPRSYRTSFDIIIQDKWEHGILEKFPCENKSQLEFREGEWILAFREKDIEVVNQRIPVKGTKPSLPSCFYPLPL